MATAINTIKGWFTTGKFPTQAQFWAWIDAFRHKDDKVPAADIEGLTELLSPVNEHFNDPNAHSDLFANFAEINTILEDKGFVKTSESFTPNSGTRWNLKGQVFTNEVSIEMPISLCSTGFIRIDRVVLDMNNQFVYVIGDEFTENPVPKALPANTLDYTLIPVSDTEVGDPSSPVIGDIYQEKKYDLPQNFNGSGSDVVIELNQLGRRVIILSGPITSIMGMKMSPPYGEYPHDGKIFVFINQTGQPVTFRHYNTDTDFFFYLKNEIDLVFPPGERMEFMLRSGVLEEHLCSWEPKLLPQDLQGITDKGNITTNNVVILSDEIRFLAVAGLDERSISLSNEASISFAMGRKASTTVYSNLITGIRSLELPNESGTLAVSETIALQNSFSTYDEVFTGKFWIDGKKIYRKVFLNDNTEGAFNDPKISNFFTIDLSSLNVDFLIPNIIGVAYNEQDPNYQMAYQMAYRDFYRKDLKKLVFEPNHSVVDNGNMIWTVIVEYTKNDSPLQEGLPKEEEAM